MKTLNKKKNKKTIIIALVIAVLLVAGGVFAYTTFGDFSKKKNESTNSQEKKANTTSTSTDSSDPSPEGNKTTTNTDPQAPTTTDDTTNKTIVTVVTSANISDGVVYIRGGVNNIVDTSGTCYASLKGPNGTTVRKDTTMLKNASTTDCKTIQIPTSELTTGTWSYALNYSSSASEGTSSENTFTIQ